MSNAIYSGWKQLIGRWGIGIAQTIPPGTLRVGLLSTSYTFSQAHDFLDDVGATIVGTSVVLPNATFNSKTLVGDGVTFTAVTGDPVKALLLYMHTGTASTSRLIAYLDTSITGLPFTPSGTNAVLSFDAAGILDL